MLVDMRPVESSENITIMDEIDELLGTRRSYGWNSGSRPSMISAKYRLKEERRKVLKISVNKMKKIDDAESSLCRSVLINNTVKRLQAETRDDRATGRTSPASPPSPASVGYGYLHGPVQQSLHQPCGGGGGNPQLVDITNLRESPGGVNGVVVVGKTATLLQTNNNNNSSSINNNNNSSNKSSPQLQTDALQSSSLAADQLHSHHHHPHQHHPHQNHPHHNHPHHHHQHHHHHHQHLLHPQQQQQQQYEYDDCGVEDECGDDDDHRRCSGCDNGGAEEDDIASIMMHSSGSSCGGVKRKRSPPSPVAEEPLDDLLSQFINCSGGGQREDEDVNVVDLDLHEYPAAKRLRTDEAAAAAAITAASPSGSSPAAVTSSPSSSSSSTSAASAVTPSADLGCPTDCWSLMDACCDDSLDLYGGQVPAAVEHQDVQLLPASDCCGPLQHQQPSHGELQQLSCGQASMFSEMQMQSAMFRNLIASLES